jgi:hypothetical protein
MRDVEGTSDSNCVKSSMRTACQRQTRWQTPQEGTLGSHARRLSTFHPARRRAPSARSSMSSCDPAIAATIAAALYLVDAARPPAAPRQKPSSGAAPEQRAVASSSDASAAVTKNVMSASVIAKCDSRTGESPRPEKSREQSGHAVPIRPMA